MIQKKDFQVWSYMAIRCIRYFHELVCKVLGALFLRSLNNIWAYIRAPEIWVLVLVIWVLFVIATVDQIFTQKIFSSLDSAKDIPEKLWVCVKCGWKHGFQNLFSLPQNDMRIVPRLIYFVTWLVGGGALVGSILSTSRRFAKGEWRKWPWLVRNHTVVLGWDENVPTRICEHLASRKLGKLNFPETFYVLSSADAEEIRRTLRPIFRWWNLTINLYVYKGVYDDCKELNGLRLQRANKIIVVGEKGESAHDSRVLYVPSAIRMAIERPWYERIFCCLDYCSRLWWSRAPLVCHLKINDFGLYWQQLEKENGTSLFPDVFNLKKGLYARRMEVRYDNFHDSWAKRLFSGDKAWGFPVKEPVDKNSTPPKPRVLILGFGAMGKAVAVELLNREADRISIKVALASRNEFAYEWDRFNAQFPDLIKKGDIGKDDNVRMESSSLFDMLKREISQDPELTIIISLKKAEKGMALALSIIRIVEGVRKIQGKVNVRIALSREDSGSNAVSTSEEHSFGDSNFAVRYFGMSNGAGYDEWKVERKAFERFCAAVHKNTWENDSLTDWLNASSNVREQNRREVLNAGC